MKKRYFLAIAIIVAILPIIVISIVYFAWSRNIFDNPDFWYGYMAYFGTACLAMVSLWQNENANSTNKELSEKNLYYQKIVCQKLYPIISVKNIKSAKCISTYCANNKVPSKQTFFRYSTWNSSALHDCWEQVISVNLDCEKDEETQIFQKSISFECCNLSESVIRHISIDDIVVCGVEKNFEAIHCTNKVEGDGLSSILNQNESIQLTVDVYFKSDVYKKIDDSLGGISMILFLTNTTITGVQQKQYVSIWVAQNNTKVAYGDKTYTEVSKKWTN
ncbi:hypothetical protein [Allofournierella massiliensis]|uniref:Uncharacterized protein n=1 Tax=Allofournierella massiliensis TaxID=1650663 RepID=A0ABT7UTR7_9FIRM|nr:hypothetical protein [Fournierella massiliensis]MDM8202284.1 hypothetical protein [Fournierella massiliensis]